MRGIRVQSVKHGVYVPRWAVAGGGLILLLLLGFRILTPPSWRVQRLDSPDGAIQAKLMLTAYANHHYEVMAKDGIFWQRLYTSPTVTNDYRTDLRERIFWDDAGRRLGFELRGESLYGYDFAERRRLTPAELEAIARD
jgi:hypothetical protein